MISELLAYLTTPCPGYVRRMGYLYEAIALRERYLRHKAAWKVHLESSRKHVMKAAESCRNREIVLILGSGMLLDIPLEQLSQLFRKVVLVDIVCLPEIRRRIRGYGNVSLVPGDVTGVAETLYQNIHLGLTSLPEPSPKLTGVEDEPGLVVSMNLLSQLSVVPRDYILKHNRGIPAGKIEAWCRNIVKAHYESLISLSCSVCLVTDYEYARRDQLGNTVEQGSTVSGMSLPEPDESWVWNIAPPGEESRRISKELIVGAWHRE